MLEKQHPTRKILGSTSTLGFMVTNIQPHSWTGRTYMAALMKSGDIICQKNVAPNSHVMLELKYQLVFGVLSNSVVKQGEVFNKASDLCTELYSVNLVDYPNWPCGCLGWLLQLLRLFWWLFELLRVAVEEMWLFWWLLQLLQVTIEEMRLFWWLLQLLRVAVSVFWLLSVIQKFLEPKYLENFSSQSSFAEVKTGPKVRPMCRHTPLGDTGLGVGLALAPLSLNK